MLTLATIKNGTIFRFQNDPYRVTYQKVGTSHYRWTLSSSNVCMPARCGGPLGENEPVVVLKAPIVTIPGS